MEVSQVVQLSEWLEENLSDVMPKFTALVAVLQNNSQQPSQQPVTQPLKELSRALADMQTSELSTLQLGVLENLEVAKLVGKQGKAWINHRVRATTYDPATTFQTVQQGQQKLQEAQRLLKAFQTSAGQVGFSDADKVDAPTPYVFNVVFQENAAIENVRDWKKTATDWELIISGVTAVAGEKPEDVAVVGAQNGSIIYTLSATPIVTKILATVSKHIASIANDYLDFQLKREELRRSQMMSDAIEKDLKRQEDERRASGKATILEAIKEIAPSAKPEEIAKLEKAVDRHIKFSEDGGDVDFVLPPELDAEDEDYDEDLAQTVDDVRELIQDYRSEVQKTKLLTYVEDEDEDEV
ncbi:hypothetical protein E2K80_01000 [Rhodophyticola sp. CCM32]|uniref:hypothetical protein n=1 Tax=Rhodophyticola sp. CCM32 TaxID=2916397 RepID=UPI00107F6F9A|nr:hypothetical protein [Rhodophyticola sp. CCM32]QBX99474.1 hypothetical protein E2K80_01000 [Rhodophyticola sp. CCM32]